MITQLASEALEVALDQALFDLTRGIGTACLHELTDQKRYETALA